MKLDGPIGAMLLFAALTAGAAQAHNLDTLGTPDPYWETLARASSNGQIAEAGAGPAAGAAHPRLLRTYLGAVGALLAAVAVFRLYARLPKRRPR